MNRRPSAANPDFRRLFEAAPGLYLVLAPDLVVVAASDAYLAATMTRRAEVVGRSILELFPDRPDDPFATGASHLRVSIERAIAQRRPDEMPMLKQDVRRPAEAGGGSEERYWSSVNSPVFAADGSVAYVIHRVEDVTEVIRVSERSREQGRLAERLRDRAGRVEAEVFRRARELHRANAELRELHANLEARVAERTAELEAVNGRMRAQAGEQRRTLAALRDSEERYRRLFLTSPEPMWVCDRATLVFLAVNDAALRLYGYSLDEFAQMTLRDMRPAGDLPALLEHLVGEQPELGVTREWHHVARNGSVIDVELSTQTLPFAGREAVLVHARDVTDRKRLEAELRQSQRLESVARLAEVVVHDFNNLLTVMLGCAELIGRRLPAGDPGHDDAREIVLAARRAAALTQEFLEFSRQHAHQPAPEASPPGPAPGPPETPAQAATILLVEDDEPIRRVLRESLEFAGFRVLEAPDGEAALALCADERLEMHLLLSDVVMPRMNGPELARRAAQVRPGLRVLFVSGYAEHALVDRGVRAGGATFLQKPFTPAVLVRKVREVLEEQGVPGSPGGA